MEAAASIVGLLTVGAQVYRSLEDFASTCKDAPETAKAIRNEVGDFRYALQKLAPYIRQTSEITPLGRSSTDIDQLKITLASCVDTFSQTQKLLDHLSPTKQERMDYLARLRWSLAEDNLNKLQIRIEKHKTTLILLLTIWTSESSAQTEKNVDCLNDLLTNIIAPGREVQPLPSKSLSSDPPKGDPGHDTVSDDSSIHTISTVKSFGAISVSKHSLRSILMKTRPYRNPDVFADSGFSVSSSQRQTHWSLFTAGSNTSVFSLNYTGLENSGRSLAEEPNLCQVLIPLHTQLLYNPRWYPPPAGTIKQGRRTPYGIFGGKQAQSMEGRGSQDDLTTMTAELYSTATSYEDFALSYRTNLLSACLGGDLLRIRILFEWEMEILRLYPEWGVRGFEVHDIGDTFDRHTPLEMPLGRGFHIGDANPYRTTPLYGHHETVRIWLGRGTDPKESGKYFKSFKVPLDKSIQANDKALVRMLLDRGAEVRGCGMWGRTHLHTAALANNQEMVEFLLDRGVDIHKSDAWGRTALHIGVELLNQVMVRLLLDRGADINTASGQGITALYIAVEANNREMVEFLLDRGAVINQDNRCLPLHGAAKRIDHAMVKVLLDRGADINITDKHRRTVLDLVNEACEYAQEPNARNPPQPGTQDTRPAKKLRGVLLARGAKSGSELDAQIPVVFKY